jgi:hypothetical protein
MRISRRTAWITDGCTRTTGERGIGKCPKKDKDNILTVARLTWLFAATVTDYTYFTSELITYIKRREPAGDRSRPGKELARELACNMSL